MSVGAALLIVVGVMISMSGGKQDADTAGGDTAADTSGANTAGGAGGDTAAVTAATGGAGAATNTSGGGSNGAVAAAQPATPADEWEVFAKLSSGERESDVLQRLNKAKGDPAALKSIYDWFSNDKLKANKEARDGAEMAAREARKTDGSLEWVRSALGESNGLALLNKCLAESPKAFEFAQDDELKLKELATELEGDEWVDAKRYKELEALVARITAREASLSADPRLVQVEVIEKELRKKPVFANLKFIRTFADPYVIFQEYPEILGPDGKPDPGKAHVNKQRLEKARLLAARDGLIFQELNRQFLSLFGDRFKLNGTLKENNRLLVCVMLWDREKFDKWNQEEGSGIGPGVRAYYSPTQKVIMHYVGDEAMKAQDEFPCDGDRVQKQSDQVTFHEGTHQLMHEYSNIFVGTPLKDGVVSVRMGRTMWFDEGLAEFMGAAELDRESLTTLEGAKWSHNRVLLERIELVRRPGMREAAKKWTIANLIQPDSNQTMASKSSELLPGNQLLMINLFYARGWGLVHFCWFYDNGKYRENFLKYMEGVLKGEFGPKEFAKAFGRPNENDWGTMDDEFNWYWDELASRRCGRKINRATGQPSSEWFVAETAPPVGVYDPNEGPGIDFGDDE